MANPEKRTMQDVIPKEKRTIRNVRMNGERLLKPPITPKAPPPPPPSPTEIDIEPPRPPSKIRRHRSNRSWPKILIVLFIILFVLFLILNAFGGAAVKISPRQEETIIKGTFIASVTQDFISLPYEVFSLTREGIQVVEASGEKQVDAKASGTIIVFNNFDANNQKLIANTRFETPGGLVYRIRDPISVPGQKLNSDGELIPGSLEVAVLADKPGEKYNVGLTDFTIPGFKEANDPRFDAFFARSKTPMTGGFSGIQKIVAEDDIEDARKDIDNKLKKELASSLESDLPEDFVTFDNLATMTFRDLPQEESDDKDSVGFRREGKLQSVVFDKNDLAAFIAENTIASYDGAPVFLDGDSDLAIVITDPSSFNINSSDQFEFTISGEVNIVWELDEERLKEDLAGKSRSDIQMVLSAYPSITEADITIYPFWRRSFPEKAEDVHLEYK